MAESICFEVIYGANPNLKIFPLESFRTPFLIKV